MRRSRAGQGLPDAVNRSRSGGASGWPSAAHPACDKAHSTQQHHPALPGTPGQTGARPAGSARALQSEQCPRLAPGLGGAARLQEAPGAGRGAGAAPGPKVTAAQRHHHALCTAPHRRGTASTRVGSRGGLPLHTCGAEPG